MKLLPFILFVIASGCAVYASAPIIHTYPSGLQIVRLDSKMLTLACAEAEADDGQDYGVLYEGCYDKRSNAIFIENSCTGARALIHEWAHLEGITEPSKKGFDWE